MELQAALVAELRAGLARRSSQAAVCQRKLAQQTALLIV